MSSVWEESVRLPKFRSLEEDIDTDVLIVGGGMAGLLCGYFLKCSGVDYVIAERAQICSRVTENTTAKITAQHSLIYSRIIKENGKDKAMMYLEANQAAVKNYYTLCRTIDCDFEQRTSYIYSTDNIGALRS